MILCCNDIKTLHWIHGTNTGPSRAGLLIRKHLPIAADYFSTLATLAGLCSPCRCHFLPTTAELLPTLQILLPSRTNLSHPFNNEEVCSAKSKGLCQRASHRFQTTTTQRLRQQAQVRRETIYSELHRPAPRELNIPISGLDRSHHLLDRLVLPRLQHEGQVSRPNIPN